MLQRTSPSAQGDGCSALSAVRSRPQRHKLSRTVATNHERACHSSARPKHNLLSTHHNLRAQPGKVAWPKGLTCTIPRPGSFRRAQVALSNHIWRINMKPTVITRAARTPAVKSAAYIHASHRASHVASKWIQAGLCGAVLAGLSACGGHGGNNDSTG